MAVIFGGSTFCLGGRRARGVSRVKFSGLGAADPPEHQSGDHWTVNSARYERLRFLGQGGNGVVHEVFDQMRGRRIALKTLSRATPQSLYRFKQEFRALAEIRHTHLVRLYELFSAEDGNACFTMELIEGEDFRKHTRAAAPSLSGPATREALAAPDLSAVGQSSVQRTPSVSPLPPTPAKLPALRSALAQLVAGLRALHASGRLHRDIKPSNVMVSREGRVVILDFGLSSGILHRESDDASVSGTPEFMAPEQVQNEPLLPAADWYAVGVLLFDSLVGHPPFRGDPADVLANKLLAGTIRPSQFVHGVPRDLDELCAQLLAREPSDRPRGKDVALALESAQGIRAGATFGQSLAPAGIVSRTAELDVLLRELSAASQGTPTALFLHGVSGVGKSTLVSQFVERARREQHAITFEWRVYEQEAIPFRALDGLLDQLCERLRTAPEVGSSSAPMSAREALGQLFPVLRSLSGFNPDRPGRRPDPLLTRRLAARGLLGLLRGVARHGPLVLVMDDAQWGDLDSAGLLGDALAEVVDLPVLFVFVHRELGAEGSRFLSKVRAQTAHLATRELALGTLSALDVRELLVGTLGSESAVSDELVDAVVRHSSGNAFLVQELAHTVGPGAALQVPSLLGSGAAASLDGLLLSQRLEGLEDAARRLLEVVSTSGRAVRTETAAAAAGVDARLDALVSSLSQRRLLRTAHDGEVELLEVRHDRIREWILVRLSADERRGYHRRLAKALEATPDAEPDVWLEHWLSADDPAQIRRAGLAAAERATARLALKRAEALYRTVLAQGQPDAQQAREVYRALAEVLEWDGRGADAAAAYLEAAELTSGVERSALQSSAGMRLIYAGRFSEGAQRLRASLLELGLPAPSSGLQALARLVIERFRLARLEGHLGLRASTEYSEEGEARVDVLHAAAFGFILTDPLVGECMQVVHVVAAQKYGSETQLARALSLEASQRAHRPRRRGQADAAALFGRAEQIATDAKDEDLLEFIQACRGVAEFLVGRWSRAHELLRDAYRDVPRHRAGWHTTAWTYDVLALCNLGRFQEVGRRSAELIEAADARGDRFTSSMLRVCARAPFLLARGDSQAARAELVEGMQVWDLPRFLVQHWRAMWWSTEADLYDGLGRAARERCLREEKRLEKSFLLRVHYIRAMTCFLRARCALATFDEDPRARAAETLTWQRKLSAEGSPWTNALAAIVLAGESLARGALEPGAEYLRRAAVLSERADMVVHAHVCRSILGEVIGGSNGEQLRRESETALRELGVEHPRRFAAALLPYRRG